MTTCSRCGKVLAPESIHTCSPQVAAPSGWLTMSDRCAAEVSAHVAEIDTDGLPQPDGGALMLIDAWGEAVAQRDRAVAAEAMVAGRDNQVAALRQLAEEAIAEIENVERAWHYHAKAHDPEWCSRYRPGDTLTALRSRLAEMIGGGE